MMLAPKPKLIAPKPVKGMYKYILTILQLLKLTGNSSIIIDK